MDYINKMNNLVQNLTVVENVEEFIPIYETDKGEKVVSGRELHQGLGVQRDFTDWIKQQLNSVDATEKDFSLLKGKTSEVGGRPTEEYILKLEIAKEICLVAGASPRANETLKQKSKAYRKYLIQFEEKHKNQISNLTEKQMLQLQILNGDEMERIGALKQYEGVITKPLIDTIEKQSDAITEMKPMALVGECLEVSKDSILVRELAKILKQNGIDIGQNRLFEWLRDNGYLIKTGSDKNMPTQRAMNMKLFEVKHTNMICNGETKIRKTTMVTGKGINYFINKFVSLEVI